MPITDYVIMPGADYEAAFGDCMDVCLTGVIDRDFDEKGEGDKKKRYATETVRKLYFRGTPMIHAGGRFADGSVPEYMVFDKPNMGAEFLKIVEEGMEKSKTEFSSKPTTKKKTTKKPEPIEEPVEDEMEIVEDVVDEAPFDIEETDTEDAMITLDADRLADIRTAFKGADATTKAEVKKHLVDYNDKLSAEMKSNDVNAIESLLGLNDEL